MIYQDTHTNFLRSRLCTWSINTPPNFLNGKPKNQPTPYRFDLFFFGWHNALTSLRMRAKAGLIFLFNIRFIIVQLKRVFKALCYFGEILRGRGRDQQQQQQQQHQPRPSHNPEHKSKQRLTFAPLVSGTKCTTTPTKRPN